MAKPDFNRFDHIQCWPPQQKLGFDKHCIKVLEKDDLSLLQIKVPHVTYFNRKSTTEQKCLYDVLHNSDKGYDQKSSRCDRRSERIAKKKIHEEEETRIVPVRVSSIYGKRKTCIEKVHIDSYKRFNSCKEFKRRNNINIKPGEGLIIKDSTF